MTKKYDPFERGSYPVGVKSDSWRDEKRDTTIDVEIWYPADKKYEGMDLDPATKDVFDAGWTIEGMDPEEMKATQDAVRDADPEAGKYPLVLLVHGWAGHRRESTFVGTHLASHGYVVVSADYQVSTYNEVDAFFTSQEPKGDPEALKGHIKAIAARRKEDVPFLIDTAFETQNNIDTDREVGITGASYGGWTSLMAPIVDKRVTANVPMCPAVGTDFLYDGGTQPIPILDYSQYSKDVKTLLLLADKDSILPLSLQLENASRLENEFRIVVMMRADHNHFVDDIDAVGQEWLNEYLNRIATIYPGTEMAWELQALRCCRPDQLTDGEVTKTAWRGLILAHMDRVLKNKANAYEFIKGDIDRATAAHGAKTFTIR